MVLMKSRRHVKEITAGHCYRLCTCSFLDAVGIRFTLPAYRPEGVPIRRNCEVLNLEVLNLEVRYVAFRDVTWNCLELRRPQQLN